MSVESLIEARKNLSRALDIYAPLRLGPGVRELLSLTLTEFEAAVREDERVLGRIAAASEPMIPVNTVVEVSAAPLAAESAAFDLSKGVLEPAPAPLSGLIALEAQATEAMAPIEKVSYNKEDFATQYETAPVSAAAEDTGERSAAPKAKRGK